MSVDDDIGITWDGKEYVVRPDQQMGLAAAIEDVITIEELTTGVKRAKLAGAFAAAIRYAARCQGAIARVDERDVWSSLFNGDSQRQVTTMIDTLARLMIPPEHLQLKPDIEAADKKKPISRSKKTKAS